MNDDDAKIGRALLWMLDKLEDKFLEAAAYELLGVMQPSPTEWGINTALNKCAAVIADTRKEIQKEIDGA